jgi:hypothetical protein
MPALIEDAGEPLSAGRLFKFVRLTGRARGTLGVGALELKWELAAGAVTVTHPPADGGAAVRYRVRLVTTAMPTGGSRWWFACPACGARAGDLYLAAGRDRLACRWCCGLKYAGQSGQKRRRRKKPRLGVVVVREELRWTLEIGYRTLRRRSRRL